MAHITGVICVFLVSAALILGGCGGGGGSTGTGPVQNPRPTITSITPSSALAGSANTSLTINGSGFISTSVVQWNGSPLTTTYDSTTSLTATVPANNFANAATANVTVVNSPPGGGTSSFASFSVNNPAPTITTVSPTSVTAGAGDTTLDLTGSGFVSTSVISWNGSALTTTFVSTTELKATISAADLTGSSSSLVTVQNQAPGGGTSTGVAFNVNSPIPAITSISPRYVPPGAAATITIIGTGFDSNSVVLWNNSARPTTNSSTTMLKVSLSASDLQNQGNGSLVVSNPAPAASVSAASQLTVTALPVPLIQSAAIASVPTLAGQTCSQLQVTITGQNFETDSIVQVNGVSIPLAIAPQSQTTLVASLPVGYIRGPGTLSFTVTDPDFGPTVSDPLAYSASNPPVLALCATPSPTTVYPGSTFSFTVQPSEVNLSGSVSLTLGTLPTGVTIAKSSVPLPASGISLQLQAAASTSSGTYDIALNAAAGSTNAKGDFNFIVSSSAPPPFSFLSPPHTEVGVPIGGSGSIQFSTFVGSTSSVDYDVVPSVTGLPPGTTASFSPSFFIPGQSVTVTLTAAGTAPVTQNATVTLIGTPAVQAPPASINFFADVTQPPGSLPGNRTDFVSTAGTPYAAVYDATHNLIFASNPSWNRVDVISNTTHAIVKSIPVLSPRGIDLTQDSSKVWVQTASTSVYSINTSSLQASQHQVPNSNAFGSSGLPTQFGVDRLLALSDDTLFIYFGDSGSGGGGEAAVWNPQNNQLTVLSTGPVTGFGAPMRSGDGRFVYSANESPYKEGMDIYNANSKSLSTINSTTGYPPVLGVNLDGTRLILSTGNNSGPGTTVALFDNSLNLVGTLPGSLMSCSPQGGVLFSPDGSKVYEIGAYNNLTDILTIDASTLNVLGVAPPSPSLPVGISGCIGTEIPFGADATGMVFDIQIYGISFDDSTFFQNYAINQPPSSLVGGSFGTYAGPLTGGTVSSLYIFPSLTPDVWFGRTRGSADISQGSLQFTSPPSTAPGPVNVKFIYPDGEQAFYPQLFSYSTFPQYAVTSGSGPNGGAAGQIIGYGLPQDPSGGTLTVGSNAATITSTKGQYPPFSGEPFPSTYLNFTFPSGTPGPADLRVTTPIGTGLLPKSVWYAKSISDYSSPDSSTFTAVLLDAKRNQIYVSAGDHIDVFSTNSNQFVTPLKPAAMGSQKQFAGLTLTPDGSLLLATDLLDGSLAVINPDSPSSTYAIPIAPVGQVNTCPVGPIYVAATSTNLAFVTTGSLPALSCPSYGSVYVANLQSHAVIQAPPPCTSGLSTEASADGSLVAIGQATCLYTSANSTYTSAAFPSSANGTGITISGDGNVIGADVVIANSSLNMLGSLAQPVPYYSNASIGPDPDLPLLHPRLNASGSLYYFAFPAYRDLFGIVHTAYFEIIDVPHATLKMRFSLTEAIQNTAEPLAIDSGGRYVYLLTDQGLTVIDLGAAPLSIGHLSQQSASPGTQITVRGSGFDSTLSATVGGAAATVNVTDENTLTLTVPTTASGPEDIVLTRGDGVTYTLENGILLP